MQGGASTTDEKIIGFGPDPGHEGVDTRMGEQGVHGGVLASQFGLGQHRVDLTMANAVQVRRDAPALAFGDQVVSIPLRRWNRS